MRETKAKSVPAKEGGDLQKKAPLANPGLQEGSLQLSLGGEGKGRGGV